MVMVLGGRFWMVKWWRREMVACQFFPLPQQMAQFWNFLPLHVGHFICPYSPVPLHNPQGVEEVPEPWQVWQMAAKATPSEANVAANPNNKWRRVMVLSSFMVVSSSTNRLFAAVRKISPGILKKVKTLEYVKRLAPIVPKNSPGVRCGIP